MATLPNRRREEHQVVVLRKDRGGSEDEFRQAVGADVATVVALGLEAYTGAG